MSRVVPLINSCLNNIICRRSSSFVVPSIAWPNIKHIAHLCYRSRLINNLKLNAAKLLLVVLARVQQLARPRPYFQLPPLFTSRRCRLVFRTECIKLHYIPIAVHHEGYVCNSTQIKILWNSD